MYWLLGKLSAPQDRRWPRGRTLLSHLRGASLFHLGGQFSSKTEMCEFGNVVDMISGLCKVTWCLKVHSLGENVLVTEWKDSCKVYTGITDGTPVKGQLDT